VKYVLKDINFDFDKYNIRPRDAEILKENLNWFKANPGKRVRIEGHCDERGTSEYNLVLGQKRADATKNYLVNLGVDEKLLETVSYGKERPLDPGHNEEAWAKNRRAHFLVLP
jgi:peptidoglycan-associated lipoprotein